MNYAEIKQKKLARYNELLAKDTTSEAELSEVRALSTVITELDNQIKAEEQKRAVEKIVERDVLPALGTSNKSDELRAFRAYVTAGVADVTRAMTMTDAGYSVPTEVDAAIRKIVIANAGLSAALTIRPRAGIAAVPVFTGVPGASWTTDGATLSTVDMSTGSANLFPRILAVKGNLGDALAASSDEQFVADFVDAYGKAIWTAQEAAFWLGAGSPSVAGIASGSAVDGTASSINVNMNTGSVALASLSTAYSTIGAEHLNQAVWVVTNAFTAKVAGLANTSGDNQTIGLEFLNKGTILGKPVVQVGTSVTYAAGTPIAVLADLSQYKVAAFNNGNAVYKRIVKDTSTDHILARYLDAKLGRKASVVIVKAA